MKKFLMPAFIIVVLVQWYVPGKMLWSREQVLKKGVAYRFETEPIDPVNPFKGKYIVLNYEEDVYVFSTGQFYETQEVYVLLRTGEDGFAKISAVSSYKPDTTAAFVKAMVQYVENYNKNTLYLKYPFEEFYMDEYKAPKAETVYRQAARDSTKKTYAVVKIWKGESVLENVFIGDTPIVVLSGAQ